MTKIIFEITARAILFAPGIQEENFLASPSKNLNFLCIPKFSNKNANENVMQRIKRFKKRNRMNFSITKLFFVILIPPHRYISFC